MLAKRKVDKQYNKNYDTYVCPNHSRKGDDYCTFKSARISDIDTAFLDILKAITLNKDLLKKYMTIAAKSKDNSAALKKELSEAENRIKNLTTALSEDKNSTAVKYIISEIEDLDRKVSILKLNRELLICKKSKEDFKKQNQDIDFIYGEIKDLVKNIDKLDYDTLNKSFQMLLKECVFDGENLNIVI